MQIIYDPIVLGFGQKINKSSTSYIYRAHGATNAITIGSAEVLSYEDARNLVIARFKPKMNYANLTFCQAAQLWGQLHASKHRKTYKTDDLRRLSKWILPEIGDILLRELKRTHVLEVHGIISETSPVEANRCVALVRAIIFKMIDWDFFQGNNPAARIQKNKEAVRDRVVRGGDLASLLRAISQNTYANAFYLMLNCGLRRSEALGARWEDLHNGVLILRGTKNGRDHRVTLPQWLSDSLEADRQVKGYIFRSQRGGGRLKCVKRHWQSICREAGVKGLRMHDLRRTFATLAVEGGASIEQVSRALNHSSIAITQRYVHQSDREAVQAFKAGQGAIEFFLNG
jgi:integrase